MSMLLYKSCRPFSRSTSNIRIRHLRGTMPPSCLFLLSSPPLKQHGPYSHLSTTTTAAAAAHTLLYPMISCYSTLAIQSMSPLPPQTTQSSLVSPPQHQHQQHQQDDLSTNGNLTSVPASSSSSEQRDPSSPLWLNDIQLELKKIQQWINSGKHHQALHGASTLPYHENLLADTSKYSELLDPYAMLLERRLTQGKWVQGLSEFGQLSAIPGWGTLLQHNRRAIKAVLVMHCAQGNWSTCESMLNRLHIKMTPTTVARMVTVLMDLKKHKPTKNNNKQQQQLLATTNKYAVRGQHIVWALQTFERKLQVQVTTDALCRIVGYLGDRGLMEDAYRIYCWARRQHSTTTSQQQQQHRASKSILYLTMINAAIINNDTAKAERIWHERLYRGTFSNHPATPAFRPASLSSYNLLLNIYASHLPQPNLARVHRTYRRLLNAGYTPDTYTYNILIKAFVNVGKPDLAYQVYDTMITTNDNNQHDSRAINLLLRGWIEKREWHRVEQLVQRLSKDDMVVLDQRAFNIMLQGFLHLDGRVMTIEHLLKSHGDWTYWKHLHTKRQPYTLTSADLWQLWTTVTGGLSKQHLLQRQQINTTSAGFATLFSDGTGFNQVSCKLFIKAFTLANDQDSAEIIKTWMFASYPPILEKKPLI